MIGEHIQNYEITAHLGKGGMGTVYKATDKMLGRDVALKMLHANLISESTFLERFKKEARVLAQLLHPNIAVIYNLIEQDTNQFMVMEYVEGRNLEELMREFKPLSYEAVVPIFIQALEGLYHAHKKGIYHRDIKPSNIILNPEGTVKIMDFGIAKIAGEQRMTQVNRIVGTVEYMAPELIEGKDSSIASDIYATGVTMYELLTGRLPFESKTDFTLMQEILKSKPVAIEKLNAAVPKPLAKIIMKSLEKKQADRFVDAKQFQQALLSAFPQLASLNLNTLKKTTPPDTQYATIISNSASTLKPTALHGPSTGTVSAWPARISSIKEQWLSKEKRPYLVGVVGLLLIAITTFALLSRNSSTKVIAENKNGTTGDSTTIVQQRTGENNGGFIENNPPERRVFPTAPVEDETKGEEKKEETKGKDEKEKAKKEKYDPNKPEEKNNKSTPPVKEEEKKDEKKEPEKIVDEPIKKKEEVRSVKTFTLNSRVEVKMYLNSAINPSSMKEGQSLSFTVTSPVYYNGEMIIEKGATATGRIKNVSNKKMSVVVNNVESTSGQRLAFQEVDLSGRIEEIVSSRNYSAYIKKGITITL